MDSKGVIDDAIGGAKKEVAKKLGKCKKLRSADVLAAMYYVASPNTENSVLRLLILGEMFTELGKANGFIKGNQAGVPEREDEITNVKDIQKDDKNKHLGTLATKDIRSLAATIGKIIRELLCGEKWLKKEMTPEKGPAEQIPENADDNNPEQKEKNTYIRARINARNLAIEVMKQQESLAMFETKYGEPPEPALPVELKPRDTEQGKYKKREKANQQQLDQFMKNADYVEAFNILITSDKTGKEFRDELNKKYKLQDGEVSLRAILNALTEGIYKNNNLRTLVALLPMTGEQLKQLLMAAETKLRKSHNRDDERKRINIELRNWVTIITTVEACKKEIEMVYDGEQTYDELLADVVKEIKNIEIKVVDENGDKLKGTTIDQVSAVDVTDETALPGLTDEYKKRLKSLNIGFEEEGDYRTKYKKIIAFLAHPNEANLSLTEVKIVDAAEKILITEANWSASLAFDNFVKEKGSKLPDLLVKKDETINLPPYEGNKSDDRLGLSNVSNAFKDLPENEIFTWFDSPTLQEIDGATQNLNANDYLGDYKGLLTTLKKDKNKEYVLAIDGRTYVSRWEKKFNTYMDKNNIDKNKIVEIKGDEKSTIKCIPLENGLEIYVIQDDNGLEQKEFEVYAMYVTLNTNKAFAEALKCWGSSGCGKSLVYEQIVQLKEIPEQHNNNQQQEQPGEGGVGENENEEKNENQQNNEFEKDENNNNHENLENTEGETTATS